MQPLTRGLSLAQPASRSLLRSAPRLAARPSALLPPSAKPAPPPPAAAAPTRGPSPRFFTHTAAPRPSILSHTKTSFAQPVRAASSAPAAPAATAATSPSTAITWTDFFRLRLIRRRLNVTASILTTTVSFLIGASLLATQNLETLGQPLGLDPMVVMGLWVVGFAGVGWLLGPGVGSALFALFYRRGARGMLAKETDFFQRVRKYRVDPSTSSVQNPVPDYYGERITSVGGYRRWLKDQRAFNRKRQSFL